MKFAILKGRELLRYEHGDDNEVPPGARRLPVVVQAKPDHDPQTQYLDSYWQLADDGSCVGILYTVHDNPPVISVPAPAPVVVERIERIIEQTSNAQVEALTRALVEMQAAQRVGEIIFAAMNGTDDAAKAAISQLEPLAAARGQSVEDYVREWITNRDAQAERAMAMLKGAA